MESWRIFSALRTIEFIWFGWISRKENRAADMLAKQVLLVSSEGFALA